MSTATPDSDGADLRARFFDAPLDPAMIAEVEAQQLSVRTVDGGERAQTDRWLDAVARGFLDGERNDVQRQAFFERTAYRRKFGIFDADGVQSDVPIATFATWGAELTVPGGVVPACAVSSVTVAPTHRRRGLLRSMMLGELRTAAQTGYSLAMLTASEAGIYGRFGFGPAAAAAEWSIDVRRAGWRVAEPAGRVDFISREQAREVAPGLHDRIRLGSPGEIDMPGGHWDRFFGTRPDAEKAEELRVAQHRSDDGAVDGLVAYRVRGDDDDFARASVEVSLLLAVTDDAYAALWRFLLSMDLIGTVKASELSVDEPLWWMIADQRAVSITVRDHQYLRVLDVAAALEARRYDTADTVVLEIDDPWGIAAGRFVLTASEDGSARVTTADGPVDAPTARMGVAELSALLLGGVSPTTLARAGRIRADEPARLTRLFAAPGAPRLSFWY